MAATFIDFADLKQKVSIHQCTTMLGLTLKVSGAQMRGTCPACGGGDRALVITPGKAVWYCFSAKKGGDAIALVSHIKGVNTKEAANLIDGHFGISILPTPRNSTSTEQGTSTSTSTGNSSPQPRFDPDEYVKRLDPAHEALKALGLAPETLQHFRAGYASAGVMRGRLALPLHDMKGSILGFCGRALDDKEPRLVFPKNFNPQSVAFNWHAVRDTDFVYLCLDPLEVLKAYQSGVENAVAALGNMDATFLQVLSLWMEERQIASIEPM